MSSDKSHNINWTDIFSVKNLFYTIIGALLAVIALKGFMIPNHFIDGGVIGISILLHEVFHLNISLQVVVFNIPFIYLSYKKIGPSFAMHSTLAICVFALLLQFITIDAITHDKLLIAIFGGVLIGAGFALIIKAGGVLDGFEIIAEYTNKYIGLSSGEWVLFVNSIVILMVAVKFGIETGMYSLITYFTAMKVSDYVIDGFNAYTALTIISSKDGEVKDVVANRFNKAFTVYKGERGYLPGQFDVKYECDIIVTIVTRLEILRLKKAIFEIDPKAFIYASSINEVHGGVIKKLRKH